MNEEQKQEVAVFRFGVISDFVGPVHLERGEQKRLLREKCDRKWSIPYSQRTRLTKTTILRWIKRYKGSAGDLQSLCPVDRSDRGASRGIDEETALALLRIFSAAWRMAPSTFSASGVYFSDPLFIAFLLGDSFNALE
jgi:putative transposase